MTHLCPVFCDHLDVESGNSVFMFVSMYVCVGRRAAVWTAISAIS